MNKLARLLCSLALTAALPMLADDDMSAFDKFRLSRQLSVDAEALLAEGDYKNAAENFRKTADLVAEPAKTAYLVKSADALLLAEKTNDAFKLYQTLLQNHSLNIPYDHVVVQLRTIAENFVNGKGTFLWLRDVPMAIKVYEMLLREAPAPHLTVADRFRLAELLQQDGREAEAVAVYQAIIKQNSRNWDARAKLALLLGKLAQSSDGDGMKTRAAVREANLVIAYQPQHSLVPELKKLLEDSKELNAQRLLEQAQFYLIPMHRRPAAARRYLHDVITNFPNSQAAETAKQLLASHPDLVKLEQNSPEKPAAVAEPQPKPAEEAKPAETKSSSSWYGWLWPFGSDEPEKPAAEEAKPAEKSSSSWYGWLWPFGSDEPAAKEAKPAETKSSSSWYDWLWPFGSDEPEKPAAEETKPAN